jgi:hypothetical protein
MSGGDQITSIENMKMRIQIANGLMVAVLATGIATATPPSVQAQEVIISPTAEEATSQFGDWIDTIDGTGLNGGGTSGDILSETHAASGGGNFALFPGGPDFTGESITFTLVEASRVDRVHLWLERSVWGDVTGFDLEFSTNGGTTFPTTVAGMTFDGGAADLGVVQTRTFVEQTGITHIRLSNVVVTGGNTAYAGFNEIRFGGTTGPDITPPTVWWWHPPALTRPPSTPFAAATPPAPSPMSVSHGAQAEPLRSISHWRPAVREREEDSLT